MFWIAFMKTKCWKFSLKCFVFTHNDLNLQLIFMVSMEDVTTVSFLKIKIKAWPMFELPDASHKRLSMREDTWYIAYLIV